MKLESPLLNLISSCQSICLSDCCGIDAYDFSPIHIASYLIMHNGVIDENEVSMLKNQLESLKVNYGTSGASSIGVKINEMNQSFNGKEIDLFVNEIVANINVAIRLVKSCENERYKTTEKHPEIE